MNKPALGSIYEYRHAGRNPRRLKVIEYVGPHAVCATKEPAEKKWTGETMIRADRFNPSNHLHLFRKAS